MSKEKVADINKKIHSTFAIIIIISIALSLGFSLYGFSKVKFEPKYDVSVIKEKNFDINNCYHTSFKKEFVIDSTILMFLKNLFLISLFYNILCYSYIIKETDLIARDGRKVEFSKFISHGLYIVITLTLLYMLSSEFFIPRYSDKLEVIRKNSARACSVLLKGNDYYKINDYNNALSYYYDYLKIIEKDQVILDRRRELENKIKIKEFQAKSNELNKPDTTIPETKKDFYDLADIYYQKKDYQTALYYYKFIADSNGARQSEAKQKIESIKKILKYENSMKSLNERLNDKDLDKAMNQMEKDIQNIYLLKEKANELFKKKDFINAYFTNKDILGINPNLRDVVRSMDEAYSELRKTACEKADLDNAKVYPGKKDFTFFSSKNNLVYFGNITVGIDTYYLYDIKIYNLDDSFNVRSVIEAPFGETKGLNAFTLYAFNKDDRKDVRFPIVRFGNRQEISKDYIFNLPASMDLLYDFSYDYSKTLLFSLIKLFKLKNIGEQDIKNSFSAGFNNNFIKTAITEKISMVFLFFSINLIFIGFSYRFRASYLGNITLMQIILMTVIPVFLYLFINIINIFVTSFYSILMSLYNFNVILIICFVINIVITLGSIIYIATCK